MTETTASSIEDLSSQYKVEDLALQQILILEKEFRQFNAEMKTELLQQQEDIKRMEVLCQRYIPMLDSSRPCCNHPDVYPYPTQECLLQEMAEKIKAFNRSNYKLFCDLKNLRKACIQFEEICSQLDMNAQTPLILGDTYHRPLSFYIELISDLFKYFHAWIMKLKYMAHLLEPTNLDAVQLYKDAVQFSEDFEEYLDVGLTYCKCLSQKILPPCKTKD